MTTETEMRFRLPDLAVPNGSSGVYLAAAELADAKTAACPRCGQEADLDGYDLCADCTLEKQATCRGRG